MFFRLLFIALTVAADSNVFPEEPAGGEGTVFVPVNSTTTFRCSVAVGYTVSWQVQRPGTLTSVPITVSNSQFELTISNRSSMLTMRDVTEELNETRVFCVATEVDDFFSTEDREVLVIVYGPPPSPTQLVANVSTNTIDISWSFSSIPAEVPVNFSLMISTPESIRAVVVLEENYVFDAGSGRCTPNTYLIRVVAVNPAGSSLPAEVSVTLPPVLDLSSVMDSLEYSLTRDSSGQVQLNVLFQNDNPSLVNYTLKLEVLEEFGANATSNDEPNVSNNIVSFLVDLVADTKYKFFIEATSGFGNCSLGSTEIMTTDVQSISLCQLNETSFSMMCIFLTGSLARGCVYTLVSTSEERVTGRVGRGNSSEGVADLNVYDEVILMDWESDGMIGTTPVRLDLNFTTCPTVFSSSLPPSNGSEGLNIAAVVVPVVLIIIIAFTVLIVIAGIVYTRVRSKEQEGSTAAARGETDAVYDEIGEVQLENQVTCEDNPAYGTTLQPRSSRK